MWERYKEMESTRFGGRKALHLSGVAFPISYLAAPSGHYSLAVILLFLSALSLGLDAGRLTFKGVNSWFLATYEPYLKEKEREGMTGLGPFLFASALTILFFERPLAIASLFFLSLGDLAAALVGHRWGRVRIGHKSLEGSGACFALCIIIGLALLPLKVALLGALVATLTELFSNQAIIDDNLSIPLIAGLVMTLVS